MKRIIAAVLTSVLFTLGLSALPAQASCGLPGAGTSVSPWLVSSEAQLRLVGNDGGCVSTQSMDQHYKLTNDIQLAGSWAPIQMQVNDLFVSIFDGNDKTISGLSVTSGAGPSGENAGLFSILRNSTVRDLRITGTSVSGFTYVGSVAGYSNSSHLQNVQVSLSGNVSGWVNVGGLVGRATNGSSLLKSSFKSSGAVLGTYNPGDLSVPPTNIGGAVGRLDSSSIDEVGVAASVSAPGLAVGGIVGYLIETTDKSLTQIYYLGPVVRGSGNVGGLVGYAINDGAHSLRIADSAVRGQIETDGANQAAAFIGNVNGSVVNVVVTNSYSAASFVNNSPSAPTADTHVDWIIVQGGTTYSNAGMAYEIVQGSVLAGGGTQMISTGVVRDYINSIPTLWNIFETATGLEAQTSSNWVIDTRSAQPLNDARPMPKALYNAGFFGDVGCNSGSYSASGNTPCLRAQPGTYVPAPRLSAATSCAIDTYQANASSVSCNPCPSGYEAQALGSVSCTLKPARVYSSPALPEQTATPIVETQIRPLAYKVSLVRQQNKLRIHLSGSDLVLVKVNGVVVAKLSKPGSLTKTYALARKKTSTVEVFRAGKKVRKEVYRVS